MKPITITSNLECFTDENHRCSSVSFLNTGKISVFQFWDKNGIHPILGKNGNLLESHKTVMGNSWEIKMPQ